jgi:hypothetical protein
VLAILPPPTGDAHAVAATAEDGCRRSDLALRMLSAFALKDRLLKSWPETADTHRAAATRRVSATRIAPTSG